MNTPKRILPSNLFAIRVDGATTRRFYGSVSSLLLVTVALSISAHSSRAQVSAPAAPSQPVPEQRVPVKTVQAPTSQQAELITLDPFVVNTDRDRGFMATNAGTATKLGLDLKDLPAPYSVMTGEFIQALGITNLQQAVNWSTNGAPVIDAQGADLFLAPSMYNVRGVVINAGQQRNYFLTASIGDAYNVERIDFGRGPNAVLFNVGANDVLGGGISTTGKRARLDKDFQTVSGMVGSWDNYRTTIDVNQRFGDKFAVRGNAVWQDSQGYLSGAMNKVKGITLAATYKFGEKTELRAEVLSDKVERSNPALPMMDNLSGWDGTTVFDGPVSNLMYMNSANPGKPNASGQSLTYEGSPQGVWRENGPTYVYVPGKGVMNYIHTASTRRGDENNRVPLYSGGQVWTRNGNPDLLPFGNTGGQGRPSNPDPFYNGSDVPLYYKDSFPTDIYDRQIAASNFRLPGKRFTVSPTDAALFTQWTKGAQLGFTHQLGEQLFFEIGGDVNEVHEDAIFSGLQFRKAFVDINQTLPDGSANPHYLDAYSQGDMQYRERWTTNSGIRANLASITDLGKWGHYTFNTTLGASERNFKSRYRTMSVALAADPREWQGQRYRLRYYWNETEHPWKNVLSDTLYDKTVVPGAAGADNTYAASTVAITPRWVLNDWWNEDQTTKYGIVAVAAKWFDDRVILTAGARYDDQKTALTNPAIRFGGLPNDPGWDGYSLDARYFKPDAPADWKTLTYIPKNPDGTPRSSVPLPAWDRPLVPGANGVNLPAAQYAGDRFRNDYNPPDGHSKGWSTTYGAMYHALPWLSFHGNAGTSYKPLGAGAFLQGFVEAEAEKGVAYDGGVTFDLFQGRLAIKVGYYFNRKENRLGDPPTKAPTNNLLRRAAANDTNPDGRNNLGLSDIDGGDYFASKNSGTEIEITGAITRGWRVIANYGTGRVDDYDRWSGTQAFVQAHKEEYLQVLQAAGGMLDTTQKPTNAPSAPGRAVVNPAVTHVRGATYQQDAANDYNNIWIAYDGIPLLKDTIGIKRVKINVFTDYTFQSGPLENLRLGIGAQYSDRVIAGYAGGATVANPSFNASLPVTSTNRPWMDDPTQDLNTPIWIKQPFDVTGTVGYTMRLKSGPRFLRDRDVEFQLVIRNLTNRQKVINQDEGVTLRPPGGDLSLPYRQNVPSRIGMFQQPISFEFTTTLKF